MGVKLRKRKLKRGGEYYYLDIHDNGKRSRRSLNIVISKKDPKRSEKKRLAEEARAQTELDVLNGQFGKISEHLKNMNFNDFANKFIKDYRKKDIRIVQASFNKFKDCVGNDSITLAQITPTVMVKYMEHLIYDANLCGETAHNYFTRFKKILKSAKIQQLIDEMPTKDIRFSNPSNSSEDELNKEILEADEIQLMAKSYCGNEDVKKAFLFACFTSLGLAEIRDLKWEHLKNGRVKVRRKKTGEIINNRLSSVALKLIGEPKENDNYVFNLQRISDTAVNKNIRNWAKNAGIDKHLTFYCGRHSFAILMLMNGANLKTVSRSMGHKSINSTIVYLNHIEKLKDSAIDELPDIEI